MNPIAGFLEWLSYINLYPYYDAWNITGVVLLLFWMFWTFIHLRPKLGLIKGGVLGFFFPFMWISVVDEVAIFLSIPILLQTGWTFWTFVSRWFWKFFMVYWCMKFVYKYTLPKHELVITPTAIKALGIYWLYYFIYYRPMFIPYNFREWFNTPYPRWFIFGSGHLFGWVFSTIIYLSVWTFRTSPEPYLDKYGMGEAYMVYALKGLLNKLKRKHNMKFVTEYKALPATVDFPDRDWRIGDNIHGSDLIFIYNSDPKKVKEIATTMDCGLKILLISSNPNTLGRISQKLIGLGDEIFWATVKDLKKVARNAGLVVVGSGYYDCPPWFDHSSRVIAPTRKLGIDLGLCREIQFFEWFNNPIWSHHCYVLAEVAI